MGTKPERLLMRRNKGILAMLIFGCWSGFMEKTVAQEAENFSKRLEMAQFASERDARLLLKEFWRWIEASKGKPPTETGHLFVKVFAQKISTREEALEVLGSKTPKKISRQITYRGFLEQWIYADAPIAFCITWYGGQDPKIQNVHPLPPLVDQ